MSIGWFNPDEFFFNKIIKENFKIIQSDGLKLLSSGKFYDHTQSIENTNSPKKKFANKWKIFSLYRQLNEQYFDNRHIKEFVPNTWSIIKDIKQIIECPQGLVYFSLIPAGGIVKPHTSRYSINERIRHQLCLIEPPIENDKVAYLKVNDEKKYWKEGEILSFDDSYMHEAVNKTDSIRMVLIYDSMPNL